MDINMLNKAYYELNDWLINKDLRYYQKEAISAVIEALIQGNKSILIEMPQGSGKYLIVITVLQYLFEQGIIKKALLLSSRREIADQIIYTISKQTYLSYGNNLKQGLDSQIISTTYNNLISDKELFINYDFVICTDIRYTKNTTIMKLFDRDKSNICYLGVGYGNPQDKMNSFFSDLSPAYKYTIQDIINISERSFIYDFLQSLFVHIGFSNIQIEPKIYDNIDMKNNKTLKPDMLVLSEDDIPLFLIEAKTYRSRFISQSNIDGALQQTLSYQSQIKVKEYILILLCEIGQEVKLAIFKEYGVHLWDIASLLYLCNNNSELIKLLADQVPFSILDIKPIQIINWEFNRDSASSFFNREVTIKHNADSLSKRLKSCRTGKSNKAAQEYENICIEIITFLFEQEFTQFSTQHKTNDRIFRMDLLCGLKGTTAFWKFLIRHYNTKFIVFEFKNSATALPQNLVYITEKYLFNAALRNVAIIISRKGFQKGASFAAMGCLKETGKLILDITDEDLLNMIELKIDGKEPSDYLLSKVENLLMSVSK